MADESERENGFSKPRSANAPEGNSPAGAAANDAKPTKAADDAGRVAELEDSLRRKTEEASQNLDRYLREKADAENFRKRLQREKTEAIRMANEALLQDVLPVLDNLERAVEHASSSDAKSLVEGVHMILRMFSDVLERHGITRVEVQPGASFDPSLHEAADVQPSAQFPPNTVIRVQVSGYRLHDRLLRPARVVVASAGGDKGT